MEEFSTIIQVITTLAYIYLALSTFYILLFSVSGHFYADLEPENARNRRIVVLIPGYKEDAVIFEVASRALSQSYPAELYDVVVIADSFRRETLEKLSQLRVRVIEVSFETSTKTKALNKALEVLPNAYDLAVILDADNVMEVSYLEKVDKGFLPGMLVMQTHRTEKNMNSNMAVLDAISEEINNNLFRKGQRVLGLSAALIGSGMVFDYNTLLAYLPEVKAVGGFDKELDLRLIKKRITIHYLDQALVFDEKVQNSKAFVGQRKRWLSAQYTYLRQFGADGFVTFFRTGNLDYLNKVIQMSLFPRILLLGTLMIINAILFGLGALSGSDSLAEWINPLPVKWLLLLIFTVFSLAISIPRRHYGLKTLKAMMSLPAGFLLMFWSLLHIRKSNRKFIHTPHGLQ